MILKALKARRISVSGFDVKSHLSAFMLGLFYLQNDMLLAVGEFYVLQHSQAQ